MCLPAILEKEELAHVLPLLSDISQTEVWNCSDNIEPYMKTESICLVL
jgi:hypothetical protein